MISNIQTFKYCGFSPSLLTEKYIKEKLDFILKEAPFGSTYHLILSKKDQVLKGVVTIDSSARKYVAIAYGSTLDEVLKKILKQTKKKFHKIKQPRFHRGYRKVNYDEFDLLKTAS